MPTYNSVNYLSDELVTSGGVPWNDATRANASVGGQAYAGPVSDTDATKKIIQNYYDDLPDIPAAESLVGLNWLVDVTNDFGPSFMRIQAYLTFDAGASVGSDIVISPFIPYEDGNDPRLIFSQPKGILFGVAAATIKAELRNPDFGIVMQIIQENGDTAGQMNLFTSEIYVYTEKGNSTFRDRWASRGRLLGGVR